MCGVTKVQKDVYEEGAMDMSLPQSPLWQTLSYAMRDGQPHHSYTTHLSTLTYTINE